MGDHLVGCSSYLMPLTTISIKSLMLEGTYSYYVSCGLEGLLAIATWSFWDSPPLLLWRCLWVSFRPFRHSFLPLLCLWYISKQHSFKSKYAFIGEAKKYTKKLKNSKRGISTKNQKVHNSKCRLFWNKRREVRIFMHFLDLNDKDMALIWWYMGD